MKYRVASGLLFSMVILGAYVMWGEIGAFTFIGFFIGVLNERMPK